MEVDQIGETSCSCYLSYVFHLNVPYVYLYTLYVYISFLYCLVIVLNATAFIALDLYFFVVVVVRPSVHTDYKRCFVKCLYIFVLDLSITIWLVVLGILDSARVHFEVAARTLLFWQCFREDCAFLYPRLYEMLV